MERKAKWDEQIFLAAYALWMICAVAKITMWREYEAVTIICRYLQQSAYLLLIVRFFLKKKYTVKDVAGIFLILFSCIIAERSVYNDQIISAAIFVCCAGNVRFDRIVKYTFFIQLFFLIITVSASQIGILEDIIWNDDGRMRHGLGYRYCGYPAHVFLFLSLMWLCLRKKVKILDAALLVLLNYGIYQLTDARTDFLLAVFGIIGFFVWTREFHSRYLNSIRDFAVKYGFAVIAFVSITAHLLYDQNISWMYRLNLLLNGRLQYGYSAIQEYGFSLFGSPIRWIGQGSLMQDPSQVYNYVDCSYLKETLSYGLLFLCVLAVGYYLAGRRIVKQKNYVLSWGLMISLVYSVINAHLCYLVFNVFWLALGCVFDTERQPERNDLTEVLAEAVPAGYKCRWGKLSRVGVFLFVLAYMTAIQYAGEISLAKNAAVHQWILCSLIFLLALLYSENNIRKEPIRRTILLRLVLVFLLLACISDFWINKRFRYSAFCLFFFGSIFLRSWRSMQEPRHLLDEFFLAYKIWFLAVLLSSVLTRPANPGICYSGIFIDAGDFGISMLIAAIIFLGDALRFGKRGVINGIGAVIALYFVWTTQKSAIIVLAGFLAMLYAGFQVLFYIRAEKETKKRQLIMGLFFLLFGATAVFTVRELLYYLPNALGTAIVFGKDNIEYIQGTFLEQIRNGIWIENLEEKFYLAGSYLQQMNLLGHKFLMKINGKNVWPDSSLIMSAYRYGVAAGAVYLMMTGAYFWESIHHVFKRCSFTAAGIAMACCFLAIIENMELPFLKIGWLVFWLGLAWILIEDKGDHDEVSEYRC